MERDVQIYEQNLQIFQVNDSRNVMLEFVFSMISNITARYEFHHIA